MDHTDLEDKIIDAIHDCCPTETDKTAALKYFDRITVNSMIEEALED